jgi:PAS domain S-box-containing protein
MYWSTPMSFHVAQGRDLFNPNTLLEACRSLADAGSLIELERQLDHWLALCYRPRGWVVTCTPQATDEPLFEIKGGLHPDRGTDELGPSLCVPLQLGLGMQGHLQLFVGPQPPSAIEVFQELGQLLRVLSNKLRQFCLQLQSLAQTAELLFMRSLLHGDANHGADRHLDQLASTLLQQLNVSSIQVLIDQLVPGGVSWGIASQRVSLALSVEQRQRLLQCVETLCSDACSASRTHMLLRRSQIIVLERTYDLPYLTQLQSLMVVPICDGNTLLGAVIVGEERSWARQPILPQVVSVCALLARAVARSATQNRFVTEIIARERTMQALIDALEDAVVATRQGVIISWNRAAQDIFGYGAEDVLGRALSEVLPSLPAELRAPHSDGQKHACAWTMQTTGGRGLYLSCTVTSVESSGEDMPSMLYVFKDTSQQHELEYLKDELLSSVSHELRTPLNGIYGFGRLLLDRPHMPDAMRQEALESLQSSIERLTRMTDDFIDVARARRHRLPLVVDAVDIEQVVRSAFRDSKRRHPQHTITLRVQKNLPPARGDSLRIKQIIDNLVSNAAKYSAEGMPIRINVRHRDQMIRISVADQGIGIPKPVQERVFEAFYRADNSRSQRASGVGLGLSIVRSLVQAHDGDVTVRSAVGRGSTFTFTLPVMHSQDAAGT